MGQTTVCKQAGDWIHEYSVSKLQQTSYLQFSSGWIVLCLCFIFPALLRSYEIKYLSNLVMVAVRRIMRLYFFSTSLNNNCTLKAKLGFQEKGKYYFKIFNIWVDMKVEDMESFDGL